MIVQPHIGPSSLPTVDKLTIVPALDVDIFSMDVLPPGGFDLGFGVRLEDFSERMGSLSLGVWKRAFSEDQMKEIKNWSTCLVHRYQAPPTIGQAENDSGNLLGYIIAHLRLIAPNRTSRGDELYVQVNGSGELDPFRCSKSSFWPQIHLTDSEKVALGVRIKHLEILKSWMPWIVEFCRDWKAYYPLWVSLEFLEKFYLEFSSFRARHLFRVMALEALLCSERDKDFGRQALKSKLPKLLGWHYDLYAPYQNDLIASKLPALPLTDQLIDDMYTLRNKVAHGDQMPPDWMKDYRPGLMDPSVSYAAVLCEAAGSMLRLVWHRIISDNLQKTFADKKRMQKFFRD